MPALLNLTIKQGDTFRLTLNLEDENGDPRDLTGFLYDAQIRRAGPTRLSPSRDLYAEFDIDDTDAGDGTLYFTLEAPDSAEVPPGVHRYDIQETDDSVSPSIVLTLIEGTVTVVPDVTIPEVGS